MDYRHMPDIKNDASIRLGVFALVRKTDSEFIPPLHARHNTTQKDLSDSQFSEEEKEKNLHSYFNALLDQHFILAFENSVIVGFLSFRDFGNEVYISTIAVDPNTRNQGIGHGLYATLFDSIGRSKDYTTRTWETNVFHRRILEKLGFRIREEKDEGRTDKDGKPVLSLYFIK